MLKVCLRRAGLTAFSAGFEQPLLSKTEENETRGLCRAASKSHPWSFLTVRFPFSFTFSLTINLFSFSDQNQFCRDSFQLLLFPWGSSRAECSVNRPSPPTSPTQSLLFQAHLRAPTTRLLGGDPACWGWEGTRPRGRVFVGQPSAWTAGPAERAAAGPLLTH